MQFFLKFFFGQSRRKLLYFFYIISIYSVYIEFYICLDKILKITKFQIIEILFQIFGHSIYLIAISRHLFIKNGTPNKRIQLKIMVIACLGIFIKMLIKKLSIRLHKNIYILLEIILFFNMNLRNIFFCVFFEIFKKLVGQIFTQICIYFIKSILQKPNMNIQNRMLDMKVRRNLHKNCKFKTVSVMDQSQKQNLDQIIIILFCFQFAFLKKFRHQEFKQILKCINTS
ncbi:hypothetical protein IMG5_162000 [Ichthyophthirius multifiliis]|uniref:Transmembrane protein n=1 Tax=Ichthyophthirius multifiliis TaxID=5932 RepID=G0R047_ICHMU|nr:hypothetical protein IMG5_162000 [Ichthyophthirius multifiliis]EGR29146.1 hypothetical protein IMG5_162000 [Ichthyophthirius multifiliis]|eukprot:XP_004030382.1 hypothetical protein IMG5_162000 [Ichthyophthirius multifiliis]